MSKNMEVEWFGDKAVLVVTNVPKMSFVKATYSAALVVGSVWVIAHEYFKMRQQNTR